MSTLAEDELTETSARGQRSITDVSAVLLPDRAALGTICETRGQLSILQHKCIHSFFSVFFVKQDLINVDSSYILNYGEF